jgi:hypothetical protein
MIPPLEQEFRTYEKHKADLLSKGKGKYVLIKGDEIIGIFPRQFAAINQGYKQLGIVPFLVKRIVEVEGPHNYEGEAVLVINASLQ